jgi:hypothetical protein
MAFLSSSANATAFLLDLINVLIVYLPRLNYILKREPFGAQIQTAYAKN